MLNYLRRLFGSTSSTKRAAGLLAFTAVLSNALGLLRNVVLYRHLPLSELDTYYAAFRIPDLLFNLLIFGAVSSAFVPVASGLHAAGKSKRAERVTDEVVSWLLLGFAVLSVILVALMPSLTGIIVRRFDPARIAATVMLSRILLLQSLAFAASFVIGGALNARGRFTSYAFAPLVYNVAIIIGGFLAPRYGVAGVAWSAVAGACGHGLIQYLELRRSGVRLRLRFSRSAELREVVRLMLPRSLSQGMNQVVLIVFTAVGAGLAGGSIAIFTGMNDLQTTPTVIIANSLAVAFFPAFAAAASTSDWDQANELLNKVLRASLFLLLPSLAFAFVMRAQLVRLYIGIGSADWDQTGAAIITLIAFLAGIVPSAVVVLLSRVFYAVKDTRTPLFLSLPAGLAGIIAALALVRVWPVPASLAAGATVLATTQCVLYLAALQRHPEIRLGLKRMLPRLVSYTFGALLLGAVCYGGLYAVDFAYRGTALTTRSVAGLALQLLLAAALGGTAFWAYSRRMNPQELAWMLRRRSLTGR